MNGLSFMYVCWGVGYFGGVFWQDKGIMKLLKQKTEVLILLVARVLIKARAACPLFGY